MDYESDVTAVYCMNVMTCEPSPMQAKLAGQGHGHGGRGLRLPSAVITGTMHQARAHTKTPRQGQTARLGISNMKY